MKEKNKRLIIASVIIAVLIISYLLISLYFTKRFYLRTEIDGINASGKSIVAINKILIEKTNNYEIDIIGKDGLEEDILASEIDFKIDFIDELKKVKKEQNPFLWIKSLVKNEKYSLESICTYNDTKLKETVATLAYFDEGNITEPQDAKLTFIDGKYEISDDVEGTRVNEATLYNSVKDAISKMDENINLVEEDCYDKPVYTSEATELKEARELLNKYVATKINLTIDNNTEIIDGAMIKDWIAIDDKFNVTLDEDKVYGYAASLGEKYNYSSQSTTYDMANGEIVSVNFNKESAYIDTEAEGKIFIDAIKNGQELNRTIELKKETSNIVSNTFVDINLTEQKISFYKDGVLITSGSVVTGNVSKGMATPPGIFSLNSKETNAILRGEDYAVPVDYWMPFNGGIGMHDAKWRSTFGGDYYLTEGSHGCINTPYDVVQAIYNNISVGTTIICHY